MSHSFFKRKQNQEISRDDAFFDRVVDARKLIGFMSNPKWVKLLHVMVENHSLIRECHVKLIWEQEYTGRWLLINEFTDYQFDYYDKSMEAMITGKPRGWYDYREIEWLEFQCHLTDQPGKQDLEAIQSALEQVGQLPLVLTDGSLRLEAYRVTAA
ncbi:hypothetical protein [Hymenobacter negativus]|uniref:Uncharacterized protein n=1 Tax=Hymenobacter negativus TaxID=2795026 RepID=A0ABS0Q3U1_9BACT|nr:hypothetical protein [Hymenobacter negativus]MBH8556946.1 hypothetical protein [Hymenobacter negativus]